MLKKSDFITIPYTSDLTQAGIQYVCQSIPHKNNLDYNKIRKIISRKAVELALKRYLDNKQIPHQIRKTAPFSDPDDFNISIGGRSCRIRTFILTKKWQIRTLRKDITQLLDAPALISSDDTEYKKLDNDDIYIFAFLNALIAPDILTVNKVISAGQPINMLYVFPNKWAMPKHSRDLGKLTIKSYIEGMFHFEAGGLGTNRNIQTEYFKLGHLNEVESKKAYPSLNYFSSPLLPNDSILVSSTARKDSIHIDRKSWRNIWVYGLEIIFTGYITVGDFRKQAIRLPIDKSVFQQSYISKESSTIPNKDLNPLTQLFNRAKEWSSSKNPG